MEKYKNKKIAVLGFGVEGMSVVDFLLHEALKITVFDDKRRESFEATIIDGYERKGVSFEFENRISHTEYDVIFRSPGIKPSTPILSSINNIVSGAILNCFAILKIFEALLSQEIPVAEKSSHTRGKSFLFLNISRTSSISFFDAIPKKNPRSLSPFNSF
jgi:hypothetical protein